MVETFRAWRFDDPNSTDDGVLELDSVIAPQTALVDDLVCKSFADRDDYNIANAIPGQSALDRWSKAGWLKQDDEPAMYLYRIGFTDVGGRAQQWSGVFARTTGAPHDDRQLAPQRIAVGAEGFSELLTPVGLMPLARATDDNGAHHRIWAITQAGVIDLLTNAIEMHGQPLPDQVGAGTLILAGEATQPEYAPALGLIIG